MITIYLRIRYIIKLPLLCSGLFEPIHDIFGDRISFIFSTRHFKPTLLSFNKVMAAIEPYTLEEKGNFWFSNIGFPLEDKYRPIYEKYYKERKTIKDIKGNHTEYQYHINMYYVQVPHLFTAILNTCSMTHLPHLHQGLLGIHKWKKYGYNLILSMAIGDNQLLAILKKNLSFSEYFYPVTL